AEDGIRDFHVTGVQTCALPISQHTPGLQRRTRRIRRILLVGSLPCLAEENHEPEQPVDAARPRRAVAPLYPDEGSRTPAADPDRSEERRVGKECRSRWTTSHAT